jgi:beta-phosphoglucomutase
MKEFGILLDMDGVIVDSLHHHVEASIIFAQKHGFNITGQEVREKYFGRRNQDWMPELFGESLSVKQIHELADEKEAYFREIYEHDIKPLDGLLEFLEDMKRNNIPIAVASSAPGENIRFTLEKTGTAKYFDAQLDESFVTNGKPEPEIYLKAAKALDMPPSRCIVIEDSAVGIEAGKRAGAKVIGITTTSPREKLPPADLMIDSFHELDYQKLIGLINGQYTKF